MSFTEALRSATFRLVQQDGLLTGTAFLAGNDGVLVTCHHVARHGPLQAIGADGRSRPVEWTSESDQVLRSCDMALMRLCDWNLDEIALSPLPLLAVDPEGMFRTAVQLKDGETFAASAPLSGSIQGATAIRYRDDDLEYAIRASLINGMSIWPGMSGAAVWDPRWGAVVGIISVHAAMGENIGGFAVPFLEAIQSTEMALLLESSDRKVGRFGCEPNPLALRLLLTEASRKTVMRLEMRGIFNRNTFVSREGFAETLETFIKSDALAFPVVSAAGQGKSSLLAELASNPGERAVLLLRAVDFPIDRPARTALAERISADVVLPSACDWEGLTRRAGEPVLLLLDGLNELPLASANIATEWLPDLLDAASRNGWKLVITMRRELAQLIEASPVVSCLYRPASDEVQTSRSFFQLGQFSSREAAQARLRYRLPLRLSHSIGRQPLIMALAATGVEGSNRHGILAQYFGRLLRDAERRLPERHPATIRKILQDIVLILAQRKSQVLLHDDSLAADDELMAALSHANLIERVEIGYRIVFDEIAEYLLAEAIAENSDPLDLSGQSNVVALAIEARAARDPACAEVDTLRLVAMASEEPTSAMAVFRILTAVDGLAVFNDAKVRLIESLVVTGRWESVIESEVDLPARLPREALTLLIQTAILHEDGYGWREKDVWSKIHRYSTVSSARMQFGVARAIHDLVSEDSIDGSGLLIEWLSDGRRLAHHGQLGASHEATIGSYALCMLLGHSERVGTTRLFREVILARRPGFDSLLEAFCDDEPDTMMKLLGELSLDETLQNFNTAFLAWRYLLSKHGKVTCDHAAEAFERLWLRLEHAQFATLLRLSLGTGMLISDRQRKSFARWQQGETDVDTLVEAMKRGLIGVEDALCLSERDSSRDKLVWALVGAWLPDDKAVALDTLVVLMQTSDIHHDLAANHLELLLRRVSFEQANSSGLSAYVAALVEEIGDEGPLLLNLTYTAFGSDSRGDATDGFRFWLAEILAAGPLARPGARRPRLVALRLGCEKGDFGRFRNLILGLARHSQEEDLRSLETFRERDLDAILEAARHGAIDRGEQ